MKFGFSQQQIIETAKSLGLPTDGFIQRRVARAFYLVESNKVSEIDDGIFRVRSQYEENKSYIVNVNHGQPSCDCPDGERTCHCKHRIASMLYLREVRYRHTGRREREKEQQGNLKVERDTMCSPDKIRWIVTDYDDKVRYIIYRDSQDGLHCPCEKGRKGKDCRHKKAIRDFDGGTDGRGRNTKKVSAGGTLTNFPENYCGTDKAKAIQDKLNGQQHSDSQNGNGNGAGNNAPSLDISDPFQESEQNDIDQIEGRKNGELYWKLNNGEYVISYKGIMTLAERHNIDFPTILRDNKAVIAYAQTDGSLRLSGKPVRTYDTSVEGVVERIARIETVCELAKRNAARQLIPLPEIKAVEHKAKLTAEFDWQKAQAKCSELVGEANVNIIIRDLVSAGKLRQDNPSAGVAVSNFPSHYDRTEWLIIYDACEKDAEVDRDPESLNRWSYNSAEFIDKCKQAIEQVRESKKQVEANEMPPENLEGVRKLQMDKKLKTWLIEKDGTKKAISCREICETFEDGSLVTRLRQGIDSGADISTVELDD